VEVDERLQYKAALSLAKRTLEFVADYRTPPTPHAYELFYTVAAGLNNDLNEAVARVVAENHRISLANAEELHEEFLSPDLAKDQIEELAGKLNAEIAANMRLLCSATRSTSAYGDSLQKAEEQLEHGDESAGANPILQTLLAATQEMTRINAKLTENLATSRAQVEDMKRCLKEMREQASKDGLTGVASRMRFEVLLNEAVQTATRTGEPMSLLMIDIDHFKAFNDRFGHPAGDATLRYVASCIKSNVKGKDVVARYGGEEFTVILINAGIADAAGIAEQTRRRIGEMELNRRSTGESLGHVTVSIGVAELQHGDSADSLVNRADMCLLAAKQSGRDRVVTGRSDAAMGREQQHRMSA
jgi:diguanylate cyclase